MNRDFDVVVYGATGFTGRLVAEYLFKNAPAGLKLGLAGRNLEKLKLIQASLGPRAVESELILVDANDAQSLQQLAQRTRVVCTTVGPYALYGLPLVKACAEAGTHVCDITGEVQFMRESIDQCDAVAKKTGARIVHTCGFDSIPSDLGLLMVHEAAKAAGLSGQFTRATLAVERLKGGFSGGTIASLLAGIDDAKVNKSRRRIMGDAYSLSPDRQNEAQLGSQRDQVSMVYDDFLKRWTAPFVMANVNTRVVRRSNALLGHAYGKELRYREVTSLRPGVRGLMFGASLTAGLGALMGSLLWAPTRKWVEKKLPKPGEGPSAEARAAGGFSIRILAETETGRRFSGRVIGTSDPGYGETAKMLGESALCLAAGEGTGRVGVLTPATAFGEALTQRLRNVGMTFRMES